MLVALIKHLKIQRLNSKQLSHIVGLREAGHSTWGIIHRGLYAVLLVWLKKHSTHKIRGSEPSRSNNPRQNQYLRILASRNGFQT